MISAWIFFSKSLFLSSQHPLQTFKSNGNVGNEINTNNKNDWFLLIRHCKIQSIKWNLVFTRFITVTYFCSHIRVFLVIVHFEESEFGRENRENTFVKHVSETDQQHNFQTIIKIKIFRYPTGPFYPIIRYPTAVHRQLFNLHSTILISYVKNTASEN